MKIIKKLMSDPVLVAAWILACISLFFTKPDKEYLSYIDWRSLGILWGLMVVIQGFKENGVFDRIGKSMLVRVNKGWQLALILILLCFFSGMLITNDVALITFVPFAIMVLKNCGKEKMILPMVVLQTIGANMGSMMTPIGNPQNLYIYGVSGMPLEEFVLRMLPYSLAALGLLLIGILFLPGKTDEIYDIGEQENKISFNVIHIVLYTVMFILAVVTVLRIVPWYIMALIIFAVVGIIDRKIIFKADYILLLTFIGFFIFTGNLGRIGYIRDMLEKIVQGKEVYTSIVTSQFISNVPATLLLSGFTTNHKNILLGVNLGGLGTLIASMASLISYKAFADEYKDKKGKYILVFTIFNVVFLAFMLLLYTFLG